MSWAGPCSANFARNASAGGQLEQPSEVNSSTTTGNPCDAGGLGSPCESNALAPSEARVTNAPTTVNLESKAFTASSQRTLNPRPRPIRYPRIEKVTPGKESRNYPSRTNRCGRVYKLCSTVNLP